MREAAAGWLARRHGVTVDPACVLPVIGTKEFIVWLPTLLGCGPGDVVAHPALAYPTYDAGARLAGATPVRTDGLVALGPGARAAGLAELARQPDRPGAARRAPAQGGELGARAQGTVVASDECYIELGWEADAGVGAASGGLRRLPRGLLAVHSLSKRSNLAGYRAGFVTGDPALVAELLEIRKHAGMMVPSSGPGRDGRGAGRRRARGRAARQVRGQARAAAAGP